MYFMYVDESGDTGVTNSPTRYFILSGIVVHELRWQTTLEELIRFRLRMRGAFGLKLREEFHASQMISRPGQLRRIKRNDRLTMIRSFGKLLGSIPDLNIINIIVDKQSKPVSYDVFAMAWAALIQRFENTISHRNFPGPANADERGMLFCDHTDDKKLMKLLRQRRKYNPIPHQPSFGGGYRNLPLQYVIEDPSFRDSGHSYFVQGADTVAYLTYQFTAPNSYFRRKYARNYFLRLQPSLCRVASSADPYGLVKL